VERVAPGFCEKMAVQLVPGYTQRINRDSIESLEVFSVFKFIIVCCYPPLAFNVDEKHSVFHNVENSIRYKRLLLCAWLTRE